ncbi:PEP-CTERM sorting domain-containing protein [Calothrix sp. CCY 0018]|uniref:PEP-CTERM sorting domain-containing protein n=1 Tax=Calothrix sp. CCY 0018 TaxID=3103864 RepID=UPI0039C7464D
MKKRFTFVLTAATVLLGITGISKSARAISITPTNDGNTLTNTILGSGITVVPGSVNYNGANGASGTFTNGNLSGIGIDSGIILTTGQASSAVGPNNADDTTTVNGTAGDADLDALIPQNTRDAATLEFDFESAGGDIFFDYVFASEEYNEFTNSSFNDVFAFFLDGQNIALVPGTTTPVSINSVNTGTNSAFFNNNDPSDLGTPTPFNIEYDGFTTVFTAQALALTPGTHTIKLAVADAGDSSLDSAVFIKGSSFSDTTEEVPEPLTILGTLTAGAFGTQFMKKRKQMQAVKSEA